MSIEKLPPEALECLSDVISHGSNLLEALHCRLRGAVIQDQNQTARDAQDGVPYEPLTANACESFWQHEIEVLNRMIRQAESALKAHNEGEQS